MLIFKQDHLHIEYIDRATIKLNLEYLVYEDVKTSFHFLLKA